MNIHNIIVLWTYISGFTAFAMAVGNPFFENKKLLKLTIIPLIVCATLATLIAGEVL
jgi:hypothetical protein